VKLVNADKKCCLVGASAIFTVPPPNQSLTVALFRTTPLLHYHATTFRFSMAMPHPCITSLGFTPSVAALPSLVNGTCDDVVEKGGGGGGSLIKSVRWGCDRMMIGRWGGSSFDNELHHKKLSLEAGKRGFMFAPAGSRTLR
jgi:hypothetical protein